MTDIKKKNVPTYDVSFSEQTERDGRCSFEQNRTVQSEHL